MRQLLLAVITLLISSCCIEEDSHPLRSIYNSRGYTNAVVLPAPGSTVPEGIFKNIKSVKITDCATFPEGPSYRPEDNSLFFSGSHALSRITSDGEYKVLARKPGGGGSHLLPDGSFLLVGGPGLRRIYPDGKIEMIADGKKIGATNDITMGIHKEVYFTCPGGKAIYRMTPGTDGKVEKVLNKSGNGLDVDPTGKYLYVHRGKVVRYKINGPDQPLGEEELVIHFGKKDGGLDGCTFDAYGNFYSVHFRTGLVTVVSPKGKLIGEFFCGIKPATNITFWGKDLKKIMITAGVPRDKNTQILTIDLGITGFCGHKGATEYPSGVITEHTIDVKNFKD